MLTITIYFYNNLVRETLIFLFFRSLDGLSKLSIDIPPHIQYGQNSVERTNDLKKTLSV